MYIKIAKNFLRYFCILEWCALPQPEGPTILINSPFSTVKDRFLIASISPLRLW